MTNKFKNKVILVVIGVSLLVGLSKFDQVLNFLNYLKSLVMPVIIGGMLAFVISVPIGFLEKKIAKICSKLNKTLNDSTISILCLVLTLLILMLIVSLVGIAVVPKLIDSIIEIYNQLVIKAPIWVETIQNYNIPWVNNLELDINNLINKLIANKDVLISGIAGGASSTLSLVINILFAVVVMFHITIGKKNLKRQFKKLIYANIKQEKADKIVYVLKLTHQTYKKFLTGQTVESLILGTLMFIALTLIGVKYAAVIAILTSICAFIPYIGAFISCGVGVILTLLQSPAQALIMFIVYEIIQFIENQFIYPKVVGESVGMSPLWTFLAVLLGGKLFGLVGILFFIPLTATVYKIVQDNTNKKLENKHITID